MKYHLISIENLKDKDRYTVVAKKVNTDEVVTLKNISLPSFARVGDMIRHCEHNFYDVIDDTDNFMFRNS